MVSQSTAPDGHPFWIPEPDNLITAELRAGRWWEPYLLPLFPAFGRRGGWIAEVGAYCGEHTIRLTREAPVLAFEPQVLPYALLGLNLAVRSVGLWETRSYGLYMASGCLIEREDCLPHHPSNGYRFPGEDETTAVATIPVRAFDDTPDATQPIRSWKIDAQGCDLAVLRGARHSIQTYRPVILAEHEPTYAAAHGETAEVVYAFFAALGYHRPIVFLGGNYLAVPGEEDLAPWTTLLPQ